MRFTISLLAAASLLLFGSPSHAVTLGTANSFNVFVFGNGSVNGGDADGALAIGGTFTINSSYSTTGHGQTVSLPGANNIGLYIGGDLDLHSGLTVNGGANLFVDDSLNKFGNTLNLNGGQSFVGNSYVDDSIFTVQQSYSANQSNYLAQLALSSTGKIDMTDSNNWKVDASKIAAVSGAVKIVTIDASVLNGLSHQVTLNVSNLSPKDTLVFNVTGGSLNKYAVQVNAGGRYDQILWNFASASVVNITDTEFDGSLLAPFATVNQYRNIQGNLIASNWNLFNSVENHFGSSITFDGNLPSGQSDVPEPGVFALLAGLGLAGAGTWARRRRRSRV